MITLASTLGIYPGTSPASVSAASYGGLRRDAVKRGSTQGNEMLSWGDTESPLPGQVHVTAQETCG